MKFWDDRTPLSQKTKTFLNLFGIRDCVGYLISKLPEISKVKKIRITDTAEYTAVAGKNIARTTIIRPTPLLNYSNRYYITKTILIDECDLSDYDTCQILIDQESKILLLMSILNLYQISPLSFLVYVVLLPRCCYP